MGIGRRDPNYGQGEHTIAADEVDSLLLGRDEVIDLLRGVFSDPSYQPPMLPASALEVHRLSTLAEVDIADVVSVLEQDQMLASGALRMAQSPLYAARVPPASLKEAVARMGLNNIRDLAFGVAFQSEVFRGARPFLGGYAPWCSAPKGIVLPLGRMVCRQRPSATLFLREGALDANWRCPGCAASVASITAEAWSHRGPQMGRVLTWGAELVGSVCAAGF